MPTMVRSTSTAMWPGYWRNCGRNSPNHGPIGQGQRLGGGQERGSDSQAHGVPAYRRRARRSHSEVLHGALESVSELSSAVRFCDRDGKPERQAKKGISDRRLCYAVREAETDSAGRAVSEGGGHVGETGSPGRLGGRHGICPEDHASQERAATKMPRPAGSVAATAVKGSRSPKRAEEMAGLSSGDPILSQELNTEDKRILNYGRWKSGNPKTGFPLSHRPDRLRQQGRKPIIEDRRSSLAEKVLCFAIQDHLTIGNCSHPAESRRIESWHRQTPPPSAPSQKKKLTSVQRFQSFLQRTARLEFPPQAPLNTLFLEAQQVSNGYRTAATRLAQHNVGCSRQPQPCPIPPPSP